MRIKNKLLLYDSPEPPRYFAESHRTMLVPSDLNKHRNLIFRQLAQNQVSCVHHLVPIRHESLMMSALWEANNGHWDSNHNWWGRMIGAPVVVVVKLWSFRKQIHFQASADTLKIWLGLASQTSKRLPARKRNCVQTWAAHCGGKTKTNKTMPLRTRGLSLGVLAW